MTITEDWKLEWRFIPIKQGKIEYFIGAETIAEIDAIARVPSYPHSTTNEEWGRRVFDAERSDEEWQRPLDMTRVGDIGEFAAKPENWMLNSIMLYQPDVTENPNYQDGLFEWEESDDGPVVVLRIEARRDHGHANLVFEFRVVNGAEDDLGFVSCLFLWPRLS